MAVRPAMAIIAMTTSNSMIVNARNGNFGKRIIFISRMAPIRGSKESVMGVCHGENVRFNAHGVQTAGAV